MNLIMFYLLKIEHEIELNFQIFNQFVRKLFSSHKIALSKSSKTQYGILIVVIKKGCYY
jgi:hypothetical protein